MTHICVSRLKGKISHPTLTHCSQVTHIWVSRLTIIGSDNGLSPGRRQAIIWTNAGKLLIGPLAINFNEILIQIYTFSFSKMHLKMASGKRRPFCLGLNVLRCVKRMSIFPWWLAILLLLSAHPQNNLWEGSNWLWKSPADIMFKELLSVMIISCYNKTEQVLDQSQLELLITICSFIHSSTRI